MNSEIDHRTELARQLGIERAEVPSGRGFWQSIVEVPADLGVVEPIFNQLASEEEIFEEAIRGFLNEVNGVQKAQISELSKIPQVEEQMKRIQELNGTYPVVPVAIATNLVAVVETKRLHLPSFVWMHEGSLAKYYFLSEYDNPGVRGYGLNPGEETSGHAHRKRLEWIQKIWGNAEINIDGVVSDLNGRVEIPMGVAHKLRAKENGAVIVVTTIGPGNCLSMDDHHPAPQLTFPD